MNREASVMGESRTIGARRKVAWILAALLCFATMLATAALATPASSEVTGASGQALDLDLPDQTVPFGYPAPIGVTIPDDAPGESGAVSFLVDGQVAATVPLEDGNASTELKGLEPGESTVTAVYEEESGEPAASVSGILAVDSAAPGPEGILPCADRSVVLTMAYRDGDRMNFEGVAKYSLRGETVRIRTGGRVVATAKVGSDGTYWTSMRDPQDEYGGRTRFTASIGSAESWPRRVGQAVAVTGRSPGGASRSGSRITVRGLLRDAGMRQVVLAQQVGCRKQKVMAIRQIGSARSGAFAIEINRPDRAEPYAIYRLLAENGTEVSPPILVRSRD
jgi:hypothetical protein